MCCGTTQARNFRNQRVPAVDQGREAAGLLRMPSDGVEIDHAVEFTDLRIQCAETQLAIQAFCTGSSSAA